MSKFEKNMQEIFEIEPVSIDAGSAPAIIEETPLIPTDNAQADLMDAYEQSKTNLEEIINKGKDALEDIISVAQESEHPRAYEVAAKMIDSMVNANKELLAIQKQMRELTGQKNSNASTHIDNAVFVGSTADLGKLIKSKLKE